MKMNGAKDAREVYRNGGAAAVEHTLDGAGPWSPHPTGDARSERRSGHPPLSHYRVDHESTVGLSADKIEALRPPYVIDQVVRQGQVAIVGAESKSRKSWLAQDAGIAVVLGQPWLPMEDGDGGFVSAKAQVHVIDLELDEGEMKYRFAKTRAARFSDDADARGALSRDFRSYCLEGLGREEIEALIEELKSTVNPGDLVIVDCLYRLVPDGNETEEVAAILELLKRFAKATQAAVLLVDHFRKAGDAKARNRLSGSFVKQASPATLVAVEVKNDGMLVLNIDARSFQGASKVHARFCEESYMFQRVRESETDVSKGEADRREMKGWISQAWAGHSIGHTVKLADAAKSWSLNTSKGAGKRFDRIEAAGFVELASRTGEKPKRYGLTSTGRSVLSSGKSSDQP